MTAEEKLIWDAAIEAAAKKVVPPIGCDGVTARNYESLAWAIRSLK